MKKILWLCPLMLLMMAFIGCDDKEKDDDESLGGIKGKSVKFILHA